MSDTHPEPPTVNEKTEQANTDNTVQHPRYPENLKSSVIPQQVEKDENVNVSDADLQEQHNKHKIQQYFIPLTQQIQTDQSKRQASNLTLIAQQTIIQGIKVGLVDVDETQSDLNQILIASSKVQETDPQKMKRKHIEMQLEYLNQQIQRQNLKRSKNKDGQNQQDIFKEGSTSIFSKTQHQMFLKKLEKQKKDLEIKRKKLQEEHLEKVQHEEKLKKLAEEERLLHEKQQKNKKVLESTQKHREQHEAYMKSQEETNKVVEEIKKKKHLYQLIQEKYQSEVALPLLEEKKKKLKQIRDYNRSFNVTDLNLHEKQYTRKKEEYLITSQARNQQNRSQWSYTKPVKSERLMKILEDEKIQAKIKLQEKKREIEEKKLRKEQFALQLKERYPPKTDPKLKEQVEKRLANEKQKSKEHATGKDRKLMGLNYLEQVKKMRKRTTNSEMKIKNPLGKNQQQSNNQSNSSNFNQKSTSFNSKNYEKMRERRIQKLINSSTSDPVDKAAKIQQLQLQTQKLLEKQKRKEQILNLKGKDAQCVEQEREDINLLLMGIKAKMGIINLYNDD